MTVSSSMTGWVACSVAAAGIAALATGSLILRETARAQLIAAPRPLAVWTAPAAQLVAPEAPKTSPAPKAAASAPAASQAVTIGSTNFEPARMARAPGSIEPSTPALAFDVIRVDPVGSAVVAGHGAPRIKVSLLDGDKVLDIVESNASGEFVFVPPPLASGAHVLRMAARGSAPSKSVQVEVPQAGGKPAAVTALAPQAGGKPSAVAAVAPTVPAASPVIASSHLKVQASAVAPAAAPTFETVEIEPTGALVVTGTGATGDLVRLYLNEALVAEVRPDTRGSWSLRVGKGVDPGRYEIRADAVRDPRGTVQASAATSFEYADGNAVTTSAAVPPGVADAPGAFASQPVAAAGRSPPPPTIATAPAPSTAREVVSPAVAASADKGPAALEGSAAHEALAAIEIGPDPAGSVTVPVDPAEAAPAAAIPGSYPPSPVPAMASFAPARPVILAASVERPLAGRPAAVRVVRRVQRAPVRLARVKPAALPLKRMLLAHAPVATGMRAYYGAARYPGMAALLPRPAVRPYRVILVRRPSPAMAIASIRYGRPPVGRRSAILRPARRFVVANWRPMAMARSPRLGWPRAAVPAHAFVAKIRTIVVRPGDTLWTISDRAYGPGSAASFARMVQANASTLRNPQIVVAGQTLILPPPASALPTR